MATNLNQRDSYTYSSSVKETSIYYDVPPPIPREPRGRVLKAKGGSGGGAKPDQPDTIVSQNVTNIPNNTNKAIYTKYAKSYGIANLRRSYEYDGQKYEYTSFMSQCKQEDASC